MAGLGTVRELGALNPKPQTPNPKSEAVASLKHHDEVPEAKGHGNDGDERQGSLAAGSRLAAHGTKSISQS